MVKRLLFFFRGSAALQLARLGNHETSFSFRVVSVGVGVGSHCSYNLYRNSEWDWEVNQAHNT